MTKSLTAPATRFSQERAKQEDDFAMYGLTTTEIEEVRSLFQDRLREFWSQADSRRGVSTDKLCIASIDIVLREFRVFVSLRYVIALFVEIDEDTNSGVDEEEFLMMVAKLRGRRPFSVKFFAATVPHSMRERCSKVFSSLDAGQNGFIDEETMATGVRQLDPHANTSAEDIRNKIANVNDEDPDPDRMYSFDDFLALQARLRLPPLYCEAAQYSLTAEEVSTYNAAFHEWRTSRGQAVLTPQDFKIMLGSLGFQFSWNQTRQVLEDMGLDTIAGLEPKHLLYLIVRLSGSSCTRPRLVLDPGSSYVDAFRAGFPLDELWELGYDDLDQIRHAGWGAQALFRGGFADTSELRAVGYAASELRHVGLDAMQLRLAGFTLDELRNAGFSSEVLRECAKATGCASRPSTARDDGEAAGRAPALPLLASLAVSKLRSQSSRC